MSRVWGREETYRWPSDKPVWTITALALTVVAVLAMATHEYLRKWTYFQQAYLGMYIGSEVRLWSKTTPSLVAYRIEGKQKRAALDRDLSDPAVGVGKETQAKVKLEWERGTYNNAELREWLERAIYGGQSPWLLLWAATWKVGAGVLVVGLALAIPRDRQRRRMRKYGRRTKGPELATAAQFNRANPSNGIGFLTKERRTLIEFLLQREGKMVRVPRERESSHFLMIGDTGAGKSSLIRQILMQVEERGETAIVYDPALEYTPQFYEPGRGDVILNPLDARMPYWSPCDEVRHEAEAEGLAAALFKDDPRTNPFFVMVPRQIFAHLLIEQPKRTPQELLAILRDERELSKRLKDTEHAAAIYPDAGPQRGGMIATLNSVSNALKLLPRKEEAKTSWTATEWAGQRQGWLFVTSPPEFRERLRPLISMWLDMLVLRLMNQGRPGVRPVWLILDELQSLHALPQLHTAITESRKVKNPVVLGFQGRSQLEELYGRKAEAMLSQPATKIFLRTDEANSAKWISQTIGEVEIERLRESRTEGHFPHKGRNSRNYQLDRQTEPLVMPSEIAGLPDLHGYLKSGNLVVPLSFPYIELPQKQSSFLARENTARVIEIGKRPSQESKPREPQRSKDIAAGQEPYFQ
ncbi:MAG: type IV secretion system DNA-binding domain-containing protein [Candidatus Sulfotelmatobacter sp.]